MQCNKTCNKKYDYAIRSLGAFILNEKYALMEIALNSRERSSGSVFIGPSFVNVIEVQIQIALLLSWQPYLN